jgi:hypothetical protein
MKTFKEYLQENVLTKKYPFRVKVAGEFTSEQETKLEGMLDRFKVANFKKMGKTPIQALPLDFPQVKNCEVSIYEVTLDYPTTQQELTEYLSQGLSISKQKIVVRNPNEPYEEYQHQEQKREGALLNDPDYKEAGSPQFEDYYGDKYNSGFVKELNDLLKLQRKARGEEIPGGKPDDVMKNPGATTNDVPQYTNSPIKQSDYNPTRK